MSCFVYGILPAKAHICTPVSICIVEMAVAKTALVANFFFLLKSENRMVTFLYIQGKHVSVPCITETKVVYVWQPAVIPFSLTTQLWTRKSRLQTPSKTLSRGPPANGTSLNSVQLFYIQLSTYISIWGMVVSRRARQWPLLLYCWFE